MKLMNIMMILGGGKKKGVASSTNSKNRSGFNEQKEDSLESEEFSECNDVCMGKNFSRDDLIRLLMRNKLSRYEKKILKEFNLH